MTYLKPKQDDESWEQFARRQIAYINMLRMELDHYHRLIKDLRAVKCSVYNALNFYDNYVVEKVKE